MCSIDQTTQDALSETVEMFLDEGRMFSGYNITRVTRERLGIQLRHMPIRGEIHELQALKDAMEFGHTDPIGNDVEWTRTQVPKNGSTTGQWFFVYHRVGDDVSQFEQYDDGGGVMVDQQQQLHSAPASGASLTASGASQSLSGSNAQSASATDDDDNGSDSGGENNDGTFSPDHYKRLFIPTRFIREAGMAAGDQCHIVPDAGTNTILLVKDPSQINTGGITVTTKTVERNGDIRLRSNTLRAAGLGSDGRFRIENTDEDGTRVVRVASSDSDDSDSD